MITAQQARDMAVHTTIDHTEYLAALEWLEKHVEPKIREHAEVNDRYVFIDVHDRLSCVITHVLHRHGFAVTSAGSMACEDGNWSCLRVSWE